MVRRTCQVRRTFFRYGVQISHIALASTTQAYTSRYSIVTVRPAICSSVVLGTSTMAGSGRPPAST